MDNFSAGYFVGMLTVFVVVCLVAFVVSVSKTERKKEGYREYRDYSRCLKKTGNDKLFCYKLINR